MIAEEIIIVSLNELSGEEKEEVEQFYLDTELDETCLFSFWDWEMFTMTLSGIDSKLCDELEEGVESREEKERNNLKIIIMMLCISFIDGGVVIRHGTETEPSVIIDFINNGKSSSQQISTTNPKHRARIFRESKIFWSESRNQTVRDLLKLLTGVTFNLKHANSGSVMMLDYKDRKFEIEC